MREQVHDLVSHNGILGTAPRIAESDYESPPGATLIMHSWFELSLASESMGFVWQRHPALIAEMAHRDLARRTDNALVVVASEHGVVA